MQDRDLAGFPGAANREIDGPEQAVFAAEQGIAAAHHGTSSGVVGRAVCDAIAAIFAVFTPAAPVVTMRGPGLRRSV